MSQNLFFSIVIPTYNRAELIRNTLKGVFEQTYPHYEIIVVDNCSTDNTQEVLQPFIDEGKIRFIKHERNYERACSRNTGMENARGDFLTLLDSDDFMYPNNLEDAAKFAQENPEIKCFHNFYELVDGNRKTVYKNKFPSLKNQHKAIANSNFMSCIGNFIHRDIYTNYKFDTYQDLIGSEDWEFWLRVLADHKLGRIGKYNNGIHQHTGRTIKNQSVETMEKGMKYLVEKFHNDEHLSKIYGKYLNLIEANSFLYLNSLANDRYLGKKAFSYLRTAVNKDKSMLFTFRFLRSLRRTIINYCKQ